MSTIITQIQSLFKGGLIHLTLSNYMVQFFVFGSQLLVAHIVSAEDVGRIKLMQAIVDVSSIIAGGGLVVSIIKMIPTLEDNNQIKALFNFVLKRVWLFSLIIFLGVNLLAYFDLWSKDKAVNDYIHIYSLIILFSPVNLIFTRYFHAINQFKLVSIIQVISKLIGVFAVIFLTYQIALIGFTIGSFLSFFLTTLVFVYILRKSFRVKNSLTEPNKSEVFHLSKFNFVAQFFDQIRLYSIFLIGNFLITDREMFGQYSFALILIQGLNVITSSVQQYYIPKFSIWAKERNEFRNNYKIIERKFFLICVGFALFAYFILYLFIPIFFGDKYAQAVILLPILLLGWMIMSAYSLKGMALIALNKIAYSLYISLGVIIINIPIIFLLCLHYGVLGLAIAFPIQTFINFLISQYYFKKALKKHENH